MPPGEPLTGVRVNCHPQVKQEGRGIPSFERTVYPDNDGRFRIEGLIAGLKYELSVGRSDVQQAIAGGNPKDLTLRPGETKDVGDIRIKPSPSGEE